ncbi:MAG: S1 RNA-binding domain-containing protein, partial [Flavobacteriales bacterium]
MSTIENNKAVFAEPPADFDWEAIEDEKKALAPEARQGMEAAYEKTLSSIHEKEVLMGTVVGMNKKEVVINIGYKSEGVVPISEFRYKPDLKIGDQVEVYIEKQEDKSGQMVVSHKTARIHNAWGKVNKAMEGDEVITGYVKCRTKGGLIVDVFGIEAFLPGSQIDVKPIRDYDQFVGKNMEFKVVKINQEFKNVVVAHKALIEAELEAQKKYFDDLDASVKLPEAEPDPSQEVKLVLGAVKSPSSAPASKAGAE